MGRKLGWTQALSVGFGEVWGTPVEDKLSMRPASGRTEEVSFPGLSKLGMSLAPGQILHGRSWSARGGKPISKGVRVEARNN